MKELARRQTSTENVELVPEPFENTTHLCNSEDDSLPLEDSLGDIIDQNSSDCEFEFSDIYDDQSVWEEESRSDRD